MPFGKARGGATDSLVGLGLLAIRVGLGLSVFFLHGYSKIAGGPDLWAKIGGSMGQFGVHWLPAFWGFMASLAESLGSILLVLGVLFRPAAGVLAFTMLVAVRHHLGLPPATPNAGWSGAAHAVDLFIVYFGLCLTGPGPYALAPKWRG